MKNVRRQENITDLIYHRASDTESASGTGAIEDAYGTPRAFVVPVPDAHFNLREAISRYVPGTSLWLSRAEYYR